MRFRDKFHIYDFVLITFLIFSLYWVFVGKVLEMEPCRSLGEEWCRNQPNVVTFQRRDVPTLRRCGKDLTNLIS